MYSRVTRYFHDKGYGFIRGKTTTHSKLNGEYIAPGYYVFFKPFQSDRSDYNAKNITVIEAPERGRKNGKTYK